MILVDTSVWVDHLQRGNKTLTHCLNGGQVLTHPFVIGELALGSLQQRAQVLEALQNLSQAATATDKEVLGFISTHALHGIGIGYVDAHLLASTRLTPGATLWTLDKRLQAAALKLGLATNLLH
ncbi:VapC toxin family PIN domain ribonuclease [Rhodoferax koreense]|uniref:VapC toxin family PIN domain ribonuclease n=1 Tax=Rhodoferax koreensis TaxID=1842727 RepID=A0A1P8JY08_9BURK|nr:type II toxin-antitoxin system VapC family toxin [Rhodoferax koreense]APW38628.1 VapC toxin family PIN domain ribonuclease [Rhodoferax koreense]